MQPLGLSSTLAVVSSLMAGSVLISGPSPLQRVYYGDEWSIEVLVHFHAAHEPKHKGREGLSKEHGQAWLAKEISSFSSHFMSIKVLFFFSFFSFSSSSLQACSYWHFNFSTFVMFSPWCHSFSPR